VIRGSIEIVRRDHISGWIHAETGTLRDRLVLAFAGDRCVGAGKADRFRKDLLDAALGDGCCGFDFPIVLRDDDRLGSVTIRLQNSDAALIQRTTRLVGPDELMALRAETLDLGGIAPGCIAWMQERGWLDQQEGDFLKAVQTIGAVERGLSWQRRVMAEHASAPAPERLARSLLSLYALSDVAVTATQIPHVSALAGEGSPLRAASVSVMALWSAEPCRVALEERSHIETPAGPHGGVTGRPAPGAIDYGFGADRMLFLHRLASFAPIGPAPPGGITVFTGVRRAGTAARRELAARHSAFAA
jgi:hypothetical protein